MRKIGRNHTFRYYFILLCLSIFCCSNKIIAQSYLAVTSGTITTPTVNHYQTFECSFSIRNTGTATAPASIAYIEIADNTSFTNPDVVSGSSIKSLSIGDTTTLSYSFSVPSYVSSGSYYVYIVLGTHYFYLSTPFAVTSASSHSSKTPYPIIFIHGLNSDDLMWNDFTNKLDTFCGLQSGGKMNFCLNYDGNNSNSNFSTDYHDFTTPTTLAVGDYYTVNFAVNPFGNYDTAVGSTPSIFLSNQSAIFKQGRAVRDAIKHVIQVTGKDKVILVCHSMGGLASREYLENPVIWQADGENHVAKFFTIATPNGGSNANFTGLGDLAGIDQHSEAIRDLHYYVALLYSGVYLGGGYEPTGLTDYYNNDINCNGITGDAITGLNEKYLPSDISYSCTIGTGSSLGGDGVVATDRANINNYPGYPYLPYVADTFIDAQPGTIYSDEQTHTLLPKNFEMNMKGIDEDNSYTNDFPYHIDLNTSYYGFIQEQSHGSSTTRDYDNYTFKLTQKGTLNIKIENIITSDFNLWLVDSGSSTALSTFPISSNQNGNIDVQIQLPIGKYILETDAAPITNGYQYPYLIRTAFTSNWTTTNYTICAGHTQTLTAPGGFSGYLWNTGATSQSITVGATGYYSFKATNALGYTGPWSDSVHVIVIPLPVAGTISGASTVCVDAPITLSHSGAAGTWSAVNANASINSSGIVTGIAAGTDIISYTVTNSCGTIAATENITINPLPMAGSITGNNAVCVGSQIILSHSGATGTWSSLNGNASVSGGVVEGISAGTDIISYSVTNSCGTVTTEKNITINPLPIAGTISGPSTVCVGAQIKLTNSASGGIWTTANENASVSGGLVTGVSAGAEMISYTVTNSCGTAATNSNVIVNDIPDIPVIDQNFNLLSASSGYTYYQWLFNSSSIPGATIATYTVNTTGIYSVIVTNGFGCSASSQQITISDLDYGVNRIKIYPSPSESIVFIDWYKKVNIRLTCLDGKSVKVLENSNEIDLSDLPNGNYLISIFDENNTKLKTQVITKISK